MIDGLFWLKTYTPAPSSRCVVTSVADLVAGVAERAVGLRPVRLRGRVVRQLVLVQDDAAVLAVPYRVVRLEVLDEQAGRGDVVAVDDHAGRADVGRSTDPCRRSRRSVKPSMPWSARHTQVWSISTLSELTSSARLVFPMCGPPTRKYTSLSVIGLRRVELLAAVPVADLHQHGGELRARVDGHSGDDDARGILHLERNRAAYRGERRVAHAEHDGVGPLDLDVRSMSYTPGVKIGAGHARGRC